MSPRAVCAFGLVLLLACQPDVVHAPQPNRSPTAAIAAPNAGIEGTPIEFSAQSSSDPDGDSLSYEWRFGDGQSATSMLVDHAYDDNASYRVVLTVTDVYGAFDTVSATVTVANAAPVITTLVTPSLPVSLGAPVSIEVAFSDPGVSDSLTAFVDWGDNQTSAIGASGTFTHVYAAADHYAVQVSVRDDDGASALRMASSAVIIEAGPPNRPPVARIEGPTTAREGAGVRFSAHASSDPDGDSLRFTWNTGDGRGGIGSLGSFEGVWSYMDNGTYTVSVVAHDRVGAADTASMTVTVFNVPPVLSMVTPPAQQAAGVPASTRLTFSDSGIADTHLTIFINWGDGTRDSVLAINDRYTYLDAESVSHVYAAPGSYRISAAIRDKDGGADSAFADHRVFDAFQQGTIAGYAVFDIGTLGGNAATPLDFNDDGQIVGSSLTASGTLHAFLWENGELHDLGALGHLNSEAQRINNAGLIAGVVWSERSDDWYSRQSIPATWRHGTGAIRDNVGTDQPFAAQALNEMGDIAWTSYGHERGYAWRWQGSWEQVGGLGTEPAAINERGQIAGLNADTFFGESHHYPLPRAMVWENGQMRELGLLAPMPCRTYPDRECGRAFATGINERGQVVGFSTAGDEALHAVLWENGTIRDLWTAPGYPQTSQRAVINDRGEVAGSVNGQAFFWSDGIAQMLGSLGGGKTEVVDLNEAGAVVGTSMTANGQQHAFVWTRAQGMVDLGTGPHGFNGAWLVGISDDGDIVGYTAPCNAGECHRPPQPRAIMWRRLTP